MSNPVFLLIKKITNLLSAELAQIVVIQKTLYPRNLVFLPRKTLPRMSARAYDNIMDKYHFEDAFTPMLGLYMCLFCSLDKLRSWFCISNVKDAKTEHFTWKRKF